ncbi:MAG: GerMN domain-containing protein [Syntrophomonas sp.]
MRRILAGFLLIVMFTAGFSGCSKTKNPVSPVEPTITETIKLYYADEKNEKLLTEERQISYQKNQDKYRLTVETLLKGPTNSNYRLNISPDTRVYGTIRQNDKIIIDLSKDFNRFGGSMAEILGVGALVDTLTQFEGLKEVKILVEGEEYIGPSGQPRGFMKTFPASAAQNNNM